MQKILIITFWFVISVTIADGMGASITYGNMNVDPKWSTDGQKILFWSYRQDNTDIYVINADGSGLTRLTDNTDNDRFPTWSSDGKKVAFHSDREGKFGDIYIMNYDGSGQTRLTQNRCSFCPIWSHNGRRILFISIDDKGIDQIYTMKADGSDRKQVTKYSQSLGGGHFEEAPVWSPDDSRIAYVKSLCSGDYKLYVINDDGSGRKLLLDKAWSPCWSPDGTRIAFVSPCETNSEIFTMNSIGSSITRITNNDFYDSHPVWSPDGRKIAFWSYRDHSSGIFIMNPDGSEQKRLADTGISNGRPDWSPDGQKIAFGANLNDYDDIYVMNADGSGQIRLTHGGGDSPSPTHILEDNVLYDIYGHEIDQGY